MYKAPIKLISSPPKLDIDGEIYKAIVQCSVSVDKDELIKALQYDRGQYDKGYADAKTEVAMEIFEELDGRLDKICIVANKETEYSSFIGIVQQVFDAVGVVLAELKKKYTEGQT
jgi:hypothetical protein